jgi:hypothetical protein
MNPTLAGVSGWVTIGALFYAVFGPRQNVHAAATVALIGVGVGVVANSSATTAPTAGVGRLPGHAPCAGCGGLKA